MRNLLLNILVVLKGRVSPLYNTITVERKPDTAAMHVGSNNITHRIF